MAAAITFSVHVDGAGIFIYPNIPVGLSPLMVPVCPPPLPIGSNVTVMGFLMDDDLDHCSSVQADLLEASVSPSMPDDWNVSENESNASKRWFFKPLSEGTVAFRVKYEMDSWLHPEDGEEFYSALTLRFVDRDTITMSGPLPVIFRVRVGEQTYYVEPGGLIQVPTGQHVEVCERAKPYDPVTRIGTSLRYKSPLAVHPDFPPDWSFGYSYAGWSFRSKAAHAFTFTATATLLESISASPSSVPTNRHLRRGNASIQLNVNADINEVIVETLQERGQIDPDNLRPDDIPVMQNNDVDGVWIDETGSNVEIQATNDFIAMHFTVGNGTTISGTRSGQDFTVDGRFPTVNEIPTDNWSNPLVGNQIRYEARVSDDGRTIRGRLAPVDPSLDGGIELVLVRQTILMAIETVCTSLRDFLYGVDANLTWDDRRLVSTLISKEVDTSWDDAHILMIVGNYLPQEREQLDPGGSPIPVSLTKDDLPSTDEKVSYWPDRLWKTRMSGGLQHVNVLAPLISDFLWKRAWEQIAESRGVATKLQMQNYADALLVAIYPEQGILPGIKSFTLNGQPVRWRLHNPITRGSLDFVRNVKWSDVWLSVDSLVRNTDFYVQLIVSEEIGMGSFELKLKLTGDKELPITLHRLADDNKTYRSEKLMIAMTSEAPTNSLGARVIESVASEIVIEQTYPLIRLAVPVTKANIVTIPSLLGAYFPYYLSLAASVHGLPTDDEAVVETFHNVVVADSTITLATGIPAGVSNSPEVSYIPLVRGYSDLKHNVSIPLGIPGLPHLEISPGIRSTEVAMGDHAAAILLRDQFKRMLEPVQEQLREAMENDEKTEAFLKARYRAIVRNQDVLSKLKVENLDEDEEELRRVIAIGQLRDKFSTKTSSKDYAVSKTKKALEKLLEAVDEALERVEDAEDDDVEELLKLTGKGFQSIVSRAMPLLTRRINFGSDDGDYVWITDETGVRWVGDVKYVTELLQANEDLASADTDVLLAVVSVVPMFLPVGLLRALVAAGLAVFELGQLGVSMYEQHCEMTFALGASPVIGRDRLAEADLKEMPLWIMVTTAGLSLLGGAGDIADALKSASVALARSRVHKLVTRFELEGLEGLKNMPVNDQRDFLVAVFDARLVARDLGGAVDTPTARLLAAADSLEEQVIDVARKARKADLAADASADLSNAIPDDLRDKIPVVVDDALGTTSTGAAAEVRLMYAVDEFGFVTDLSVHVSSGATQADIASHIATIRRMNDYTEKSHEARGILSRLKTWARRYGEPPPGSLAWEARLEVEKLTSVIIEDRVGRLAAGQLSPSAVAIQQDLSWLGHQLAHHSRVAQRFEVSPGRGFVAAHAAQKADEALENHGVIIERVRAPGILQDAIEDRIKHVSRQRDALDAANSYAEVEAVVLGELLRELRPARAQRALEEFRRINASDALRNALMRSPGFDSVLGDLVSGPLKYRGAHWVCRFNARLQNMDPNLGQELLDLLGGRRTRLYEDMAASTRKYRVLRDRDTEKLREYFQAIDQVIEGDTGGIMLEFKSYTSWNAVKEKINKQCPMTLMRYHDMGWKDGSGESLSGLYIVLIDGRHLEIPRRFRNKRLNGVRLIDLEATKEAEALSEWANGFFRDSSNLNIDVRFFIV